MSTATQPQEELVAFNIRRIPRRLRQRFKMFCMRRNIDMQDAAVQLIESLLDGDVELPDGSKAH